MLEDEPISQQQDVPKIPCHHSLDQRCTEQCPRGCKVSEALHLPQEHDWPAEGRLPPDPQSAHTWKLALTSAASADFSWAWRHCSASRSRRFWMPSAVVAFSSSATSSSCGAQ